MNKALQKMRLLVARGVVNLINDAGGLQTLQINALDGETRDEVERAQNYGLTSHPPKGSVPIMVAVGGSRDHLVAVAVDNEKHRPKGLTEGEVELYSKFNQSIKLDESGDVIVTANKLIFNVQTVENNANNTQNSGSVAVKGTLSSDNPIVDNHVHHEHDGPTTGTPIR